jgi:hypothetical protein
MSISNVNLKKQIGDLFSFGRDSRKPITKEAIDKKIKRCDELFE